MLFVSVDKEFHTKADVYKKNVPDKITTEIRKLAESKTKFDTRMTKICDLAIKHFDFFIEQTGAKIEVKSKSYYTDEGTKKMIEKFLEKK